MGTVCILLGIVFLFAFTGLGFFGANEILKNELYMTLIGTNDTTMVYAVVVGVCAFVGLLICLNLVMHGSNANKLNKLLKTHRHSKEATKKQ